MKALPPAARLLIILTVGLAAIVLAAAQPIGIPDLALFTSVLAVSVLTSTFKVSLPLPRSDSTMSVSYAVDFASLLLLGAPQTLLITAIGAWSQCTFRKRERNPLHRTLFSMATLILTVSAAGLVYGLLGGVAGELRSSRDVAPVAGAATTYFLVNTALVAAAIALTSRTSITRVWYENFLWSAPGYFVGAGVVSAIMLLLEMSTQWLIPVSVLPLYLTYRSYRIYLGRIQEEQLHVKQMADLHLATIEALAIAIDAKDQTSHLHIRRVQLYAASLAEAFGMAESEIQGVRTAALLHDIGKLAIPEHILSKPSPLTPDEFQKIRSHPKIGADIISTVPFPYPVAPLILSHHERWDGKGYPRGLRGDEIPLGARILTTVDYFDALMADRPYHKGMPFEAALKLLQQEAGKALDPAVVQTFTELLPQIREQAAALAAPAPHREKAPDADPPRHVPQQSVFDDIALAHREIYALYEISQAMGKSLGLSDTMALITAKLSSLVPFSSAALFLNDEATDGLRCRFSTGVDSQVIQQIAVANGQGLIGSSARQRKAIVNGRPADDLEAAGLTMLNTELQSALICPLVSNDRVVGALAVYHLEPSFYHDDHRRLLDRVAEQAAAAIKNSTLFERTQQQSRTDALTGLANNRSLLDHFARELARAERLKSEIAMLVIDVDDFKEINDNHGHHVGDRALTEMARVLRLAIRPYDVCARYAGDEFILVLSGCSPREVEQKRLELQRLVEELPFEASPGVHITLGISVGAAIYPQDGPSYESLLATADRRMYQDKSRRKQREISAGSHTDTLAATILQ